jgi:hypothetical protein
MRTANNSPRMAAPDCGRGGAQRQKTLHKQERARAKPAERPGSINLCSRCRQTSAHSFSVCLLRIAISQIKSVPKQRRLRPVPRQRARECRCPQPTTGQQFGAFRLPRLWPVRQWAGQWIRAVRADSYPAFGTSADKTPYTLRSCRAPGNANPRTGAQRCEPQRIYTSRKTLHISTTRK